MLFKSLSTSFDGMRGENQFLRIAVAALVLSNLLVACSALNKDQVVAVIPPTLTETGWVSKTQSSSEYTDAWALYIAMMVGNITPKNASVVKEALGPILEQSIYQETMNVLDKQIHQIRQDRVTLSFEPKKVLRDSTNDKKFFVTGSAVAEGPAGDKKRSNRTYEMELEIKNYKPVLSWISTNSGNPRTQDVVNRENTKAEKQAEREKKHNR